MQLSNPLNALHSLFTLFTGFTDDSLLLLLVGCLTTLLVLRLYSVVDRIINECGAVGEMRIDRGSRSTGKKLASVSLCPPQIQHDLTCDRTKTDAVGSWRLSMMISGYFSFVIMNTIS
jgi:hypothetical protein